MGLGVGRGLVGLFKQWGRGIGNAADNFWLGAEAQKAIRDEVTQKFKPKIDIANTAESKRATNIKDLDAKVKQSKEDLVNAKKDWQAKYDAALADARTKRQTDIADYNTKLQGYSDALTSAKAGRKDIVDQLRANEAIYDPYRTIFTDVRTGDKYIFNIKTDAYEPLSTYIAGIKHKKQQAFIDSIKDYDHRLFDIKSNNKVINAFDKSDAKTYDKLPAFNGYKNRIEVQDTALRDAENQIKQADANLKSWQKNNSLPPTWDDSVDLPQFKRDFNKNNAKPTYSFNGQNYSKESDLDDAYKEALASEQRMKSLFSGSSSRYASKRDAEIAQRIQDAKDINKAKAVLGLGTAGALAGATYAAFSGDDNTDNTNNTDYGKPDPNFNIKNTPEVQAQLNDEQQSDTAPIDTGFDPDKADALASMALAAKAASESDDTPAETHPETPELAELSADDIHTNEGIGTRRSMNEGLFSVIKALQDPHQANAVADYIYSRYGNDPELQQLGWRAWLNKYYGDALRSQMNLDASGYNGMHIA